jgi:hypothetical protein
MTFIDGDAREQEETWFQDVLHVMLPPSNLLRVLHAVFEHA